MEGVTEAPPHASLPPHITPLPCSLYPSCPCDVLCASFRSERLLFILLTSSRHWLIGFVRDEMKKAETEMGRLKQEYAAEKKQVDEQLASLIKALNDERSARLEGQKLLDKLQADFEQNKRDAELKQAEMKGQIEGLRSAGGSGGSTIRLCVIQ